MRYNDPDKMPSPEYDQWEMMRLVDRVEELEKNQLVTSGTIVMVGVVAVGTLIRVLI